VAQPPVLVKSGDPLALQRRVHAVADCLDDADEVVSRRAAGLHRHAGDVCTFLRRNEHNVVIENI
jgi:hypothetical protein